MMWLIGAAWAAEIRSPEGEDRLAFVPERVEEPVRIDGVLDEAIWQGPPITGFVEMQPVPGRPDLGTRAWVAYDDRALYVAFDARVEPDRAQSNALSPRDRNRAEDTVGILLDTFRDGRRAFLFMVNGRGVQGDGIFVDGETGLGFPDLSWDGVFSAAGVPTEGRYVVEMEIPFRSLRFPPGVEQTWSFVLVQHLPVPISDFTWPTVDPERAGVLVQAAQLGPFPVAVRPGRLELLPTLTGAVDLNQDPAEPRVDPGIAARLALTTGLSAEVTVNPDFSQIESDVGQVTANVKYPLFYPERRPFFLENADLFSTPLTLVHTRSIADPLTAYKVSGRVGRVGIGFLGGYDQQPSASTISRDYATGEALPTWDDGMVEQADAVDHVARVRADVGGGDSIGFLVSDKELLTPGGRFANRVFAADTQVTAGRYQLATQVLGSSTDFGDGTTASAPAWDARLFRQGEGWLWEVGHTFVSREFRAENGFLTEVGRMRFDGGTRLLFRPGGAIRLIGPGVGGNVSVAPDGALALANLGPSVEANLGQRWTVYADGGYTRERYALLGEAPVEFDLWYQRGTIGLQPGSAWFLGFDWEAGTRPHYAAATPADLYRGYNWSFGPFTNFDAFHRMNVGAEVAIAQFGPEPLGAPEYLTVIPRGSVLMSLTPRWQVRVIEQYSSAEQQLQSSGLLGYVVNYGTVGYLGYSWDTPAASGAPPNRTVFAKIGYLSRL